MSRQSKQAKKAIIAKQITALHKRGERGPSRTTKHTTKVNTWFAARKSGRPITSRRKDED